MHSKEEPIALTTFIKTEQEFDPLKVAIAAPHFSFDGFSIDSSSAKRLRFIVL
ncbi:hypothetical protein [Pseudomonas sp. R84]|uniref:hypothetical protein n=1 Tax=Pseudomonas sp. R84 TaxID=1573712 RepID=UPI001359CAD9|nr:hypothetical protein [Pseudomonas sp. R84]